jgi:hypothetical protein
LKNASSEVKQDRFLVKHNMKVPDFIYQQDSSVGSDGNQTKCGINCLANCACSAYAYDPYIGCMYWSGELIDLQKFPYGGVDLFIRVSVELGIFSLFLFKSLLFLFQVRN